MGERTTDVPLRTIIIRIEITGDYAVHGNIYVPVPLNTAVSEKRFPMSRRSVASPFCKGSISRTPTIGRNYCCRADIRRSDNKKLLTIFVAGFFSRAVEIDGSLGWVFFRNCRNLIFRPPSPFKTCLKYLLAGP